MTVYLDTCSIQRPLDDTDQLRVRLEAEAALSIIDLARSGEIDLFSSYPLIYETRRNPHPTRRQAALEVLDEAARHIALSESIEGHAERFRQAGIKPLDALHLASAIEAKADYFGTCDDSLLNKAKRQDTGMTSVLSLLELAEAISQWLSRQSP